MDNFLKGDFYMAEKLTPQEKYELHLKAWADIHYQPTKEEVDEIQFLYKVGKYAKKGK